MHDAAIGAATEALWFIEGWSLHRMSIVAREETEIRFTSHGRRLRRPDADYYPPWQEPQQPLELEN